MPGVNTISKSVSGFDPRSIPGCTLWLDGQDPLFNGTKPANGASVTTWKDKSGLGNDGVTAGTAPTYNSTSNSLFFNSTGAYSNISHSLPLVNRSVFIVASQNSSSSGTGFEGILVLASSGNDFSSSNAMTYTGRGSNAGQNASFGIYANSGDYLMSYLTNTTPLQYYIYSDIYASNSGTMYVNSSNVATDTTASPVGTATGYVVGGRYLGGVTYSFNGVISEIIVYKTTLSSSQRQAVEGYLAWKWRLEISPNFLPTSIPTPLLWFDAADATTFTLSGASNVSAWRDKVQNLSIAVSNATYSPTRVGNSVFFNNASQLVSGGACLYTNTTWTLPTQSNSIFVVSAPNRRAPTGDYVASFGMWTDYPTAANMLIMAQSASSDKEGNYYDFDYNGTNYNTDFVGSPVLTTLGDRRLDVIIGAAASTKIYTNNLENTYMANTYFGRTPYTNYIVQNTAIGSGPGNRMFSGYVYEILVYSGAITEQQRQTVQGYLASKWNLSNIPTSVLPQRHPFIQYTPTLRNLAPIDVPDCILWLDAADSSSITTSGANVTGWADKSGNANSVNEVSATAPTYSPISRAITFTCTNTNYLRGSIGTTYQDNATVFVVGSLTSNASATGTVRMFVLGSNDATDNSFVDQLNVVRQSSPSPILATYVATGDNPTGYATNLQTAVVTAYDTIFLYTNTSTYDGTNFTVNTLYNGNTQTYSSRTAAFSVIGGYTRYINKYSIGSFLTAAPAITNSFNGNINEIVVFSRVLSTSERQTVEGYLGWKWGLGTAQPTSAPFYKYQPSVALPFSPLAFSNCVAWVDASDRSRMAFYPGTSKLQAYIDKANNYSFSNYQGTSTYATTYQSNGIYGSNGSQTTNGTTGQEQTLWISGGIPSVSATAATTVIICKPDFLKTGILYANPLNFQALSPQFSALTLCQSVYPSEWYVLNTVGPGYFNFYNTSPTTTSINIMTSGTTGGSLFTNGTLQGSVSWSNYTAANQTWDLRIIDNVTRGFTGYIYEVIVFSKVLSTTERQQIEGYLAWKWGTQTSLPSTHPYKKFPPGM